jgi:uncharacterized protein (TIGR04255 family)
MGIKYKNPPIIEALCEFQFEPGQPWDMTIPGLVYEKINDRFPKKTQRLVIQTQSHSKDGQVTHSLNQAPRMQFSNEEGNTLIQVGQDLLIVNRLKPYPTWDEFFPIIQKNLRVYKEVAKPKEFKRIGLRSINKITINTPTLELSNYLNFYSIVPDKIPQDFHNFFSRYEFPYNDHRDVLILTIGSAEPDIQDTIAIKLDIDYAMVTKGGIKIDQAEDWIDTAHKVIKNTFEACITSECRGLFGGEEQCP